ncbi:unnamed protein product [Pieris macdunnoughi]|uniref:Uncharacterized protein n=1 Tax=Pieris macdunnoughi TaxID=345717 RepID=A0A821QNM8_9NEOP|nr:unnamed protein product [Pieris macdunnoughi]
MAKLYKKDASPPARTVMIASYILGVPYDPQELNPLLREQDTPEMFKKNPMKTIPLWEEDNFCLADSHAIILYLFDKYAKPEHEHLYPRDKRIRATINHRLFFDCGILFPRLRSIMGPTYTGKLTKLSKSMIRNLESAYEILEKYLEKTIYLADNVMTLADISIFTTMSTLNGLHPIDSNRYPKLKRWFNVMCAEKFSQEINEPGAKEHVEGLLAFMKNNLNKSKL